MEMAIKLCARVSATAALYPRASLLPCFSFGDAVVSYTLPSHLIPHARARSCLFQYSYFMVWIDSAVFASASYSTAANDPAARLLAIYLEMPLFSVAVPQFQITPLLNSVTQVLKSARMLPVYPSTCFSAVRCDRNALDRAA
jgi:hypothetical protein